VGIHADARERMTTRTRPYRRRLRYARAIAHYWQRHFPLTCDRLAASGDLRHASKLAAFAALKAVSPERRRSPFKHEALVAAVDVWAIPPHVVDSEVMFGFRRLLQHRWRRLWPVEYREALQEHWDGDVEVSKTCNSFHEYRGWGRPHHEAVKTALEEHGDLPWQFREASEEWLAGCEERKRKTGSPLGYLQDGRPVDADVFRWLVSVAHGAPARVDDLVPAGPGEDRLLRLSDRRGTWCYVYGGGLRTGAFAYSAHRELRRAPAGAAYDHLAACTRAMLRREAHAERARTRHRYLLLLAACVGAILGAWLF
jgi:hypothetical protein